MQKHHLLKGQALSLLGALLFALLVPSGVERPALIRNTCWSNFIGIQGDRRVMPFGFRYQF